MEADGFSRHLYEEIENAELIELCKNGLDSTENPRSVDDMTIDEILASASTETQEKLSKVLPMWTAAATTKKRPREEVAETVPEKKRNKNCVCPMPYSTAFRSKTNTDLSIRLCKTCNRGKLYNKKISMAICLTRCNAVDICESGKPDTLLKWHVFKGLFSKIGLTKGEKKLMFADAVNTHSALLGFTLEDLNSLEKQ